ncbi:mitochondrial DNA-directed RNA polymerase [Niveomyces insectorum RCEF 264]|uniref:DNA-directed RNA polymerase n=1 Tax=Niveomyces insectorum RCEF 264 TaxID=1081102 RepID=A0A162L1H4_9HYPO|nr:mitochondrial DNA-directed RNA polymerase [Niveomyces insectorum RCEF 264]
MLLRPRCCRHGIVLRRLPSSSTLPIRPGRSSRPPKPIGFDRRLLTTRPDRRPHWPPNSISAQRSLATTAPNPSLDDSVHGAVDALPASQYPLLYPPSSLAQPQPQPRLWELRPHNVSAPLVVDEPDVPAVVRQKINTRGVPGDVDEMLPVLDACLQVGKLDRAALVLKRLGQIEFATADIDMVALHNRYLRAVLDQLIAAPDPAAAEALHKWYELEIRGKQLPQTPETIACMVKASLLMAHGARSERLVRLVDRYMGMAPGEAGLEVLYMTDILNDQDRAAITDICRTYNLESYEDTDMPSPEKLFEAGSPNLGTAPHAAVAADADADADAAASTVPDAPNVLETPQKGMGLRMLKQTLSLFSEIPKGHDIASLGLRERREIQSRLERDCVDAAVERWKEENQTLLKMGLNTSLTTASLNSRLFEWQRDLELRLSQEMKKIELAEASPSKNKEDLDRCMYGPFLRQSSPSRLAAVTIVSTLSNMAMQGVDKGASIGIVITQIAKVVEEDIRLQRHAKEMAAKGKKTSAKAAAKTAVKAALRKAARPPKGNLLPEPAAAGEWAGEDGVLSTTHSTATTVETETTNTSTTAAASATTPSRDVAWPVSIKAKVGAALLSMLMETAKVTAVKEHPETKTLISQQQPAFSRINQLKRGRKVGMLVANQTLVELMKREPRGDFLARHLPMVVEPRPWSAFDKGGFLEYPAPLVRVKDSRKDQKIYAAAAIGRGDMDQVLKGLDVLGRTAWKVNQSVFSVMLEAWNTGEAIASIPSISPNITVPAEPDSSDDPMKRRSWLKAVKAAENQRSGHHSVRCFMNFQMEIARAFRDQTFYFPHNVDFRGRAYPIPPYFNHMGADHVRGLLVFARGKALGEAGLKWLQVHLANVFGYDKASLTDRANFAIENLDNIRDAATNPLSGRRWWLQAEDPWQCLATCFELKAAMDLPDPTQYVSHLPVHQDGTCNGLQHYAALGGDTWGAKQVNLEPSDRPADVYSAVADIVKASIAEDAARGDPNAKVLDGKIKRKVVKQTVMTNVYGVTYAGARKQVLKQLDALYPTLHAESGIPPLVLASYIATKIFTALSSMFGGAHDIQHWLGEVGSRVCRALTPEQVERIVMGEPATDAAAKKARTPKAAAAKTSNKRATDAIMGQFRSTLVWTTPLRMPVVQPYRKAASRTIETCLQDLILSVPARSDPVHKRKQLQAFPPNFIHSLDASHMLLSALECDELGLTFAAVHDSFWTHASDVNTMNRVLRDAFIRIHSEDVVGRLAAEFEARYRGSMYLAQVNRSSAVAKKILAFRKTARMSLKDELVLEKQRLDLLQSDIPVRVARGKKMVTPASIFEKMTKMAAAGSPTAASEAAIEAEDISEFSLGSMVDGGQDAKPAGADAGAGSGRVATGSAGSGSGSAAADTGAAVDDATTTSSSSAISGALSGGMGFDGMGTALGDVATSDDMCADDADHEGEHEGEHEAEPMNDDDEHVHDASMGSGTFEATLKNVSTKPKQAARKVPVQIWLPLTFPAIPAKGDFDVRRLKESDYFFS